MNSPNEPHVGEWYEGADGSTLEIVAYDAAQETIEVQYYDGTLEEYDLDTWFEMNLVPSHPPEDWSGSLDMERADYGVDLDGPAGENHGNPLDSLDLE